MKTSNYLIGFVALTSLTLVGCSDNDFLGTDNGQEVAQQGNGEITFVAGNAKTTRAGEFVGATAAEKLGRMFVVEGTKGTEQTNSPSTTVVFDNYLVGYTANSAGTTESNTNNWEYVGLQTGITGKLSGSTWTALHTPAGDNIATTQSVKYWDYTQDQYDFIAWSTGNREAVTGAPTSGTSVKVTRINTGSDLATGAFTMTALSAEDLMECYYTDINNVPKSKFGQPVTLTFRNMAAKVRIALYETIPGYSVKDVYFYTSDANPTAPEDLGAATESTATAATLFTMGSGVSLPQSGEVLVCYPRIGTTYRDASPAQSKDYNKASVSVTAVADGETSTTQAFGALTNQYRDEEGSEPDGKYLGMTLPTATYAGDATKDFYTAVIPNTNGVPLTLRVDYTLVSTDGSDEEIHVYGAKAVVPATYTVWQPNYAYTYVFKISDNSNGWTSTINTDPVGLFPITFDAVVTNFVDANAEQATITTVATPSITTYQQGHNPKAQDEYSKSQTAGVSSAVKDLYVQVMDNSVATPTLKADLNGEKKSLLFAVTTTGAPISEATVMDALQNRTNTINDASPVGRNGITLTTNANISNTETSIVNGVNDQSITVAAGTAAKIDIDKLAAGTYAYVYAITVPSADEVVYHIAAGVVDGTSAANYYEVKPSDIGTTPKAEGTKAAAGKVYFVANLNAKDEIVSYTFKQTKVDDDVKGLYEASIPGSKGASTYSASNFYFDVYNQNNGAYAVKVIKVVD